MDKVKNLIVLTICYEANRDLLITLNSISKNTTKKIKSYVFIKKYIQGETEKYISSGFFCILNDTGLYNALNIAHQNINKDDYVFYLHSGDTLDSEFNFDKEILKIIKNDISVYSVKMINSKGNVIRKFPVIKSAFHPYVYYFAHTGIIFKNQVYFDLLGYDERYLISSDYDFLIKLLKSNKSINFINNNISIMSNNGLSTNPKNLIRVFYEDYLILNKYTFFPFFFLILKKVLRIFICIK